MKINGWDISLANARQARFTNGHHEINNGSIWNEGSNRPVFQKNQLGFKDFSLELIVKGKDYQEITENRGKILERLMDEAVIETDMTAHRFKAILDKYSIDEKSKRRFHILKLQFKGYEYEETETFNIEVYTSFTITNKGTMDTPVILELTPIGGAVGIPDEEMATYFLCDSDGSGIADEKDGAVIAGYDYDVLTVQGLCTDTRTGDDLTITVRNVTPGKKIIIDGETGLITEEGKVKIDDVDIWALPTLHPGENRITTNNNWLKVTVRYNPRFM